MASIRSSTPNRDQRRGNRSSSRQRNDESSPHHHVSRQPSSVLIHDLPSELQDWPQPDSPTRHDQHSPSHSQQRTRASKSHSKQVTNEDVNISLHLVANYKQIPSRSPKVSTKLLDFRPEHTKPPLSPILDGPTYLPNPPRSPANRPETPSAFQSDNRETPASRPPRSFSEVFHHCDVTTEHKVAAEIVQGKPTTPTNSTRTPHKREVFRHSPTSDKPLIPLPFRDDNAPQISLAKSVLLQIQSIDNLPLKKNTTVLQIDVTFGGACLTWATCIPSTPIGLRTNISITPNIFLAYPYTGNADQFRIALWRRRPSILGRPFRKAFSNKAITDLDGNNEALLPTFKQQVVAECDVELPTRLEPESNAVKFMESPGSGPSSVGSVTYKTIFSTATFDKALLLSTPALVDQALQGALFPKLPDTDDFSHHHSSSLPAYKEAGHSHRSSTDMSPVKDIPSQRLKGLVNRIGKDAHEEKHTASVTPKGFKFKEVKEIENHSFSTPIEIKSPPPPEAASPTAATDTISNDRSLISSIECHESPHRLANKFRQATNKIKTILSQRTAPDTRLRKSSSLAMDSLMKVVLKKMLLTHQLARDVNGAVTATRVTRGNHPQMLASKSRHLLKDMECRVTFCEVCLTSLHSCGTSQSMFAFPCTKNQADFEEVQVEVWRQGDTVGPLAIARCSISNVEPPTLGKRVSMRFETLKRVATLGGAVNQTGTFKIIAGDGSQVGEVVCVLSVSPVGTTSQPWTA